MHLQQQSRLPKPRTTTTACKESTRPFWVTLCAIRYVALPYPLFLNAPGRLNLLVFMQLQYHLYHPLPSTNPRHLSSTLPSRTGSHSPTTSFFLPPALHISLAQKSEATQATPVVDLKLPEEVGGYTGLVPLDKPPSEGASGAGASGVGWAGYRGWLYKAWKEGEGRCYVLRRIEGEPNVPFGSERVPRR